MWRFFVLFLLLISSQIFAQNGENGSRDAIVKGTQAFAFDFYRQQSSKEGNLFFSPYSIATAFAMTAAGARGTTEKEMLNVLHIPSAAFHGIAALNQHLTTTTQQKPFSTTLLLANNVWVQSQFPLLLPFQKTIREDFGSSINNVDFAKHSAAAIESINRWVAENTKGKIQHLLTAQDVTADTRLVLTSAIYMKAQWLHLFDEKKTAKKPFYLDKTKSIDANMMSMTATFPLFVDDTVAVVEIPYVNEHAQGPELVMMIALPKELDGIAGLESQLSAETFQKWSKGLQTKRVKLSIPKFKLETRIDLNDSMKALGMALAFTPKADFSGISGSANLYISKAIHQTFVDVDEKGTEAAAATAISMNLTAILAPEEPHVFNANHPFLFLIVDKDSGAILFLGRLTKP